MGTKAALYAYKRRQHQITRDAGKGSHKGMCSKNCLTSPCNDVLSNWLLARPADLLWRDMYAATMWF